MSSFKWSLNNAVRVDCEARADRVERVDVVHNVHGASSPLNRFTHTGRPVKRSLLFDTFELLSQSTIDSGAAPSQNRLHYSGCILSSPEPVQDRRHNTQLVVRVSLAYICQCVLLRQLIELCSLHAINVPRRLRTISALTSRCLAHHCGLWCSPIRYLFSLVSSRVPRVVPYFDWQMSDAQARLDYDHPHGWLDFALLTGLDVLDGTPALPLRGPCEFIGHLRSADVDKELRLSGTFVLNIPLQRLANILSYRDTLRVAASHRVFIPHGM